MHIYILTYIYILHIFNNWHISHTCMFPMPTQCYTHRNLQYPSTTPHTLPNPPHIPPPHTHLQLPLPSFTVSCLPSALSPCNMQKYVSILWNRDMHSLKARHALHNSIFLLALNMWQIRIQNYPLPGSLEPQPTGDGSAMPGQGTKADAEIAYALPWYLHLSSIWSLNSRSNLN